MKQTWIVLLLVAGVLLPGQLFAQYNPDQLKQTRTGVRDTINGKIFYIHTIKKGQTLYMICKAYDVDINEVIAENPEVKNGIQAGARLKIPVPGQKPVEPPVRVPLPPVKEPGHQPPAPAVKDSVTKPAESLSPESCIPSASAAGKLYKVALMIPLSLSEVGQIDPEVTDPDPSETYAALQFIEFYEGFRIAADSLEKAGLRLKLYVYDIGKDTLAARQAIRKPEMKSMDLIVGLLYHRSFQIVSAFAEANRIPVVNPVSERSEIVSGNPWVIKVRPSRKSELQQLAKYMEQACYRSQILIIRNNQYKDREAADQFRKECAQVKLNAQVVDGTDNALARLSKSKENVVVAFTENPTYILDLCRKLSEIRNDYVISIVGLPAWDKIDGLETEYMVNLNAHIVAPSFIDYENPLVRKFVKGFQSKYFTDPDLLAFQGFDVAWYFLGALREYGRDFRRCLTNGEKKALQTTFEFSQSRENGFENQHWEVYKYVNYRLVKVN
jgi:ABC-type branched-subunit amino acid transport system substrate-binding protein/LysM repeat protein